MLGGRALALLTRYRSGVGAAVVVAALAAAGLLEGLEHGALARFFEVRGPRSPVAPVVIVSIDESSFADLNEQWPFPRAMHARLLDRIAADQPLAIGIDLIFDVPSARGPADDAALGRAVAAAGNVVLAAAPQFEVQGAYTRHDLNLPVPTIRRGAGGVGAISFHRDADSHVRRAPRRIRMGEEVLPAFDVELHRVAAAAGLAVAPLPTVDEVLINFSGPPRTFPWVSYSRVIEEGGLVAPGYFRGKIVLIGPTSDTLHDVFPTAFAGGGDMPGVEIHANVLENYVRGNRLREVPPSASTALAVVLALAAAALVLTLPPLRALAAVALLWVVGAVFTYLGFLYGDVWLRGVAGTVALGIGYGATVVDNFVREQRERRRLSQFFSPEVLREVVRQRDEASLETSRRLVTVLFADIRGFTSLSERLEPEEVAEMLREYLTEMTEVVFKYGGTVDKYIGDCVMALYNVPFEDPDHVMNAMRTALEMQERTLAVSARWEARLGTTIRSGIGINTGDAVVGTMGSRQRLEYTAIGDTINLGSRLESLTKEHGVAIIISEFTQRALPADFLTRELGEVTVRGRTRPVKVYGVLPGDIRKHPRAVLEVSATLVLLGAGQTCLVTTRDVSEGGMALGGVPASWTPGTRVEVRCEGGLLPTALLAEGVIVWRRGDEAGISFTEVEPGTAPVVADYVARNRQ
jgi:adenylate cyclase